MMNEFELIMPAISYMHVLSLDVTRNWAVES